MIRKIKALAACIGLFVAGAYLMQLAINAALRALYFLLSI